MWRHAHYSAAEHVDTQIHTLTTAIISRGQCSSGPRHITIEDPSYPQINRTKKSVHRPKAFLATTKKGWPHWIEALSTTSLLTIPSNGVSFYFQFTLAANSALFVGIITCTKKRSSNSPQQSSYLRYKISTLQILKPSFNKTRIEEDQ
jgi:hypothetical protein